MNREYYTLQTVTVNTNEYGQQVKEYFEKGSYLLRIEQQSKYELPTNPKFENITHVAFVTGTFPAKRGDALDGETAGYLITDIIKAGNNSWLLLEEE